MSTSTAPKTDEIEITLLGPGFGESLVIHVGANRWIVIDSCIDSESDKPGALQYLDSIGVNPSTAVSHVIATHWHDDHVGGLFEIVEACTAAKFWCAAALTTSEFLNLVTLFNKRPLALSTGLSEVEKIFALLRKRKTQPQYVLGNMPILTLPAANGLPEVRLVALSPVNAEYVRFLQSLARFVPGDKTTKHRFPRPEENDISIATLLTVGDVCALLGADLETTTASDRGWNAVLASTNRPQVAASLFKVPHHGSITGHHDRVWTDMLTSQPIAILTPWNRGSYLPTPSDRSRIAALANQSFITTRRVGAQLQHHSPTVSKTLKESNIVISSAEPSMGRITARISLNSASSGGRWSIDMTTSASNLNY